MKLDRSRWRWLRATAEITTQYQGHWWVAPASLLLFGIVTAVQLAPYQAADGRLGDGSFILFGNSNLRLYVLNPIYLFIAANVGGRSQYEEFVLFRLGSRQKLWLSKGLFFCTLTVVYLSAIVLCAEIAALPAVHSLTGGWSERVVAYFGNLSFAGGSTPGTIWYGTLWLVLLSWLGLGGAAFIVAQITGRAGAGFFVAVALNASWFLADLINLPPGWSLLLDVRQPMLFPWISASSLTFGAATAYWFAWYLAFILTALGWTEFSAGAISAHLRVWGRGAWLMAQISVSRSWLIVGVFAFVSAWVDWQMAASAAELASLQRPYIPLRPIFGLSGPALDASLFSLVFLRWLLLFLIFLFIVGETAARVLWQQHVMLLPRLGGRQRWWMSSATAVAGLSLLYLSIIVGVAWLVSREAIPLNALPFYVQIFALYWSNLTLLGCSQLLLLLFTRSRSQTLFLMAFGLTAVWLFARSFALLLPWLPVAQTSLTAQLLQNGTIRSADSLLWSMCLLVLCVLVGNSAIQRYEFTNFLKHQ